MRIFGVMMVRNEADILRVNLLHHLALGVDQFLIVDNGSSDGTERILDEFSRVGRVQWTRDSGPYRQSEITTQLARQAFLQGADWVIPIDADEFWYASGGNFHQLLEESSAGGLQVEVINFIQRREQQEPSPDALVHMTRRVALPVGPLERVRELVEARHFAYVEAMYPPKWISRPSATIEIAMGNHEVAGMQGPLEETDEIVCFHAPLRSRAILEAKAGFGKRAEELGLRAEQWWQARRWNELAERGELEKEWLANSYADDCLDLYGVRHAVVFDPRLRDAVAPWIDPADVGSANRQNYVAQPEKAALLRTIHEQHIGQRKEAKRAADTLRKEVGERDRIIEQLQAELHGKVGECNQIICDLQAELHAKVSESSQIICDLQAELQAKVGERDRVLDQLQAELHAKVGESNQIIRDLQAELQSKVGERDRVIRDLQAELSRFAGPGSGGS